MKFLVALFLVSLSFSGFSAEELKSTKQSSVVTEMHIGGDKKKSRRHRRINNKRKRHCSKAARRNFAG